MPFWRKHPGVLRLAVLLLSALAALWPAHWATRAVVGVEETVGDAFWRIGASSLPERRIVLVDIDERSLQALGPWPWPRATMAALSVGLARAGAQVQSYDINFSDPRAGDEALAAAWRDAPVVVSQLFSLDATVTPAVGVLGGEVGQAGCPGFAPRAFGHYGTAAELLTARPAVGHITPRVGADGVVRHVPALICREGRAYPSLALMTLWRTAVAGAADGAPSADGAVADWRWHSGNERSPFAPGLAPAGWLTSSSLPGLAVPLDAAGDMRVPYGIARDAFVSLSAADVVSGKADAAVLRGAIAVVGASAFGLGDTIATPHGAVASGLEVHSQALVGLLDQRLPYTPASWRFWQAGLFLLVAALLLFTATRRRGVPAKRLPLVGLALTGGVVAGAGIALLQLGLWVPWLPLALFAMLGSLSLATVEHAFTRAQRERLSAHLGAYLPAPMAARLMASEPSGSLQLESRTVSVLVAEIRNFTALATHGEAGQAAALLHAFCCEAVDVVERHGGVVENVAGDSITAVWTAGPEGPDSPAHARQALATAQELVRATRLLLASRAPVADESPVQPLALGVGIESGPAIVGSYGPARRRAHAALGEPVSVASRIQQLTADLSMPIIVGPRLAALLPPQDIEPLGDYLLEGLSRHYELFAPVGWAELVSVDPNWATSAAGIAERHPRATEWSRWGALPKSGPTTLRARPALRHREA